MNIKISIEKLKLVRPKENPKNANLKLDVNWDITYKKISNNSFGYICNLKMEGEFPTLFVIEGAVEFEESINHIPDDISQSILDSLFQILVNMITITKEIHIEVKDFPLAEIPAQKVAS
ncbi:hypothetical protein [Methanotorris igneus]|uniref:FlpE-related protein n=1 Tax=Methanotorris igneus (strain DSM 5666 / JCM 11834 / Kol 5) TaxID=880724 RepID=F6BE20_METIK|nr:hypothetical protein [Methanotorris igneus]AEF96731.1 FlpE-related protein [Methanotorris igneus Kol 5]